MFKHAFSEIHYRIIISMPTTVQNEIQPHNLIPYCHIIIKYPFTVNRYLGKDFGNQNNILSCLEFLFHAFLSLRLHWVLTKYMIFSRLHITPFLVKY